MIWLSLACNYLGLAAFAAALESHRRTFPRLSACIRPPGLFAIGGVLQAAALIAAFPSREVAAALVLCAVGWAVCGLILSLLLAFRSRSWPLPAVLLLLIAIANRLGVV
ncbi:MAG: hypothetical protein ACAH89_03970 [Rariglobus sp.]|nr:hypothetical protein [Rariglobus sp.]